uniref:Uncharacterized protein n=1 Tax=Vespula pensylvanica TaxID=30213 RepID=A0A834P1A2_VESPE|nr:hypothetical protein H0235_009184 [Vespula pensylvanica]
MARLARPISRGPLRRKEKHEVSWDARVLPTYYTTAFRGGKRLRTHERIGSDSAGLIALFQVFSYIFTLRVQSSLRGSSSLTTEPEILNEEMNLIEVDVEPSHL